MSIRPRTLGQVEPSTVGRLLWPNGPFICVRDHKNIGIVSEPLCFEEWELTSKRLGSK